MGFFIPRGGGRVAVGSRKETLQSTGEAGSGGGWEEGERDPDLNFTVR